MADALLGIADVEHADAETACELADLLVELAALAVAAGLDRDRVVLARPGEVGAVHRPARLDELGHRHRRMQIVHDVAIDVDELSPVGAPGYQVCVPDLLEQRTGHSCLPKI